jgi:hypothetical protein
MFIHGHALGPVASGMIGIGKTVVKVRDVRGKNR